MRPTAARRGAVGSKARAAARAVAGPQAATTAATATMAATATGGHQRNTLMGVPTLGMAAATAMAIATATATATAFLAFQGRARAADPPMQPLLREHRLAACPPSAGSKASKGPNALGAVAPKAPQWAPQ